MQPLWHPPVEALAPERVFHALGDAVRLTVFRKIACADGLSCAGVCDQLPRSTVSHHLKVLREAGLIRSERQGKAVVNHVRRADLEARFPGLLALVMGDPEPLSRPESQPLSATGASASPASASPARA